jgi:BirA family biotin operon repressor/biotin-[acetyl-CoA-carboxylase] ligase
MTPAQEWHLEGRHVGRRVLVFDRLDSTNDLALSRADDLANDGLVVVAGEQTAGRGQHGRRWLSPPGHSVLLSALVFPPPSLQRPALLTAWAAVAVGDLVLEATGVAPAIKWPNDVLAAGRKVCGILIEQRGGTVAGIGLNVNQPQAAFDAAGLPEATSLAICSEQDLNCRQITEALLARLDAVYRCLVEGDLDDVEHRWRERFGLVGRVVRVECADGVLTGRLRELAFGGVLVETTSGLRHLPPEAVRHLRPA